MNILVFEDNQVSQLHPITTGRPAYAITCATYRLIDWLPELGSRCVGHVRPHVRELQSLDFPQLSDHLDPGSSQTLVVNARLVPSLTNRTSLVNWIRDVRGGPSVFVRDGWSIVAGCVPTDRLIDCPPESRLDQLIRLAETAGVSVDAPELPLFHYPHDVVRYNLEYFDENLGWRIAQNDYREIRDGVFVGDDVRLTEPLVTDTARGPIVIESETTIGPFSFLRGPIHIGRRARINEHAAIKDASSLAHTTKLGGEIEGCIIEAYTNKQHHGFLGHSYLGSWINLGAGTCNSDLKNTYGQVNMIYGNEKIATGMQFVGCIMGDYAKTAINTSIFTGKTIGTCSMVYGFVTTNVPSYVNYARSFGQVTELPTSVMVSTQQRMFRRRQVQQRPADVQLLHDMYELTRTERQIAEEPLVL